MLTDLVYEDNIGILTLNNPSKLNALSSEFVLEIFHEISACKEDTKVLIVKSECPKAFVAGVDIREIHEHSFESAYLEEFINDAWEVIADLKIPVIAAVSGYALGGGFELALMSDIIVASKKAVFGFPEVNLGIMPGMGGTQRLTRTVGPKIANELLMTGRFVRADEALRLGLVNYVMEDETTTMSKCMELAREIASKSTMSTRMIKDAVRVAQEVGLEQGIKFERQMFRSLFSTSFKKKGTEAFLNKKK